MLRKNFMSKKANPSIISNVEKYRKFFEVINSIFPNGFERCHASSEDIGQLICCIPDECWINTIDGCGVLLGTAEWSGHNKCYGRQSTITITVLQERGLNFAYITQSVEEEEKEVIHKEAKIMIPSEKTLKKLEAKKKLRAQYIKDAKSISSLIATEIVCVLIGLFTLFITGYDISFTGPCLLLACGIGLTIIGTIIAILSLIAIIVALSQRRRDR